jgi:hypothetical protein
MIAEQTTYSTRHGSPYDRGSADSYYGRSFDPHYWPQGTYNGSRAEMAQMTAAEITAYTAGYRDNEESGDFKEY